ncbi:GNAT family N-acetyltransferase [Thermoflavimicrobium dichotomicum]|uniref:Acetyltransferase (GNAT) family protein n=1 Tax=Thermoflavimicrobium dichotomicum TaxID=46223 RepID=A0A1I3MFF0_9BACL|nr:GNAT family N-acetyltransferase [Thermoflavimicrobium dichotomicum]SFI95834.1 Acetyltransferase (GNAT) family protein [Thermoflavimicrobium dichotomicum]
MRYIFRIAKPSDAPLLKEFLYLAFKDSHGIEDVSREELEPMIQRYLNDWGQPGDLGFIIESIEESKPVAAAWFRQFSEDRPGYGFVAPNIPEVTIAVLPEYRHAGLGRDLLMRLIDQARMEGFPGLSLSVKKSNPARKFYERLEFKLVRESGNLEVLQRAL